ncbi:hypothetical protein D1839_00425 [Roseburia sp. 1XD42-34]|nr:hypothetical protein [Roseburia sp. 1XD42-34]RKI82390.1 hypothetical protein D7V87_00425 [Clostridium sp. 1xD42-85]
MAGPKLGKLVGVVQKQLQQLSEQAIADMAKGERKLILPSGETVQLSEEDLIVEQVAKEGVEIAENQSYTVLLDTVLTEELKHEGLARELIRAVQLYRKELRLSVDQRVSITFDASEKMKAVITSYQELLETNLLLNDITFGVNPVMKTVQLDEEKVRIGIGIE